MFNNIGKKCKTVAQIEFYVGVIASFIFALGSSIRLLSVIIFLGGSFVSWIGSIGLYGIGEAVENSSIAANLAMKADLEREQEKNITE